MGPSPPVLQLGLPGIQSALQPCQHSAAGLRQLLCTLRLVSGGSSGSLLPLGLGHQALPLGQLSSMPADDNGSSRQNQKGFKGLHGGWVCTLACLQACLSTATMHAVDTAQDASASAACDGGAQPFHRSIPAGASPLITLHRLPQFGLCRLELLLGH